MDEKERLTSTPSSSLDSEGTYALLNAIEPDPDTRLSPTPSVLATSTADDIRTHSPSPRLAAETRVQDASTETTAASVHRQYPPVLRTNTPDSTTEGATSGGSGQDGGTVSESDVSSLSGTRPPSRSSLSSAGYGTPDYGTFAGKQQRAKRKDRRGYRVTFEISDEPAYDISPHYSLMAATSPSPDSDKDKPEEESYHQYYSKDTECALSKEEVDHMCDDVSNRVRSRPDASLWKHILVASILLCPACGIASAVYACKSRRYHAKGEKESAKRMLRRSVFCLRVATIFGIIIWFMIFLFLVVNKEKLV